MPKTINMKECDYRLIKYRTKVLSDLLEVQPTSLKNWISLNVDWEGYPRSFEISGRYYASAQGYYDALNYRSKTEFSRQKWAIFKKLTDTEPVELGSAFVGELVANRDKEVRKRYMASSIEFHFLRAYSQLIKAPFREAIMRAKLKWIRPSVMRKNNFSPPCAARTKLGV